jgi:alkylhydroperoxidase family enzyme
MTINSDDMINIEKNPIVNHQFKYNEAEILKDIQEYVSRTYRSHYTASEPGFRDIQTIDLMAAKDLASAFCQANILKYGSRYGSKDGKSKQDLMKVIHYAMLLLHFDGHYTRTNNGLNEFR